MTEQEWLTIANPVLMVRHVCSGSWRKRCLLVCACWRSVKELLTSDSSRSALAFLERVAEANPPHESFDSVASEACQIGVAEGEARWDAPWTTENGRFWAVTLATTAMSNFEEGQSEEEWLRLSDRVNAAGPDANIAWHYLGLDLCNMVRCVFGNPFRPAMLDRSSISSTVVSLAQAMYADRAFDRLPILADALEDAGCTDTSMLEHSRSGGAHVRGCWVVDWVLGKQ